MSDWAGQFCRQDIVRRSCVTVMRRPSMLDDHLWETIKIFVRVYMKMPGTPHDFGSLNIFNNAFEIPLHLCIMKLFY
jgi:hypothetical protein